MLVVNWKVPTPWLMKGSNVQVLKVEDIDKIIKKNYSRGFENILNRIKKNEMKKLNVLYVNVFLVK